MKINDSIKKYLKQLIETKQININIADMLLSLYPYGGIVNNYLSYNKYETCNKDIVFDAILDYFQIPKEDSESVDILKSGINLFELDKDDYLNNEYYKNISLTRFKKDGYILENITYDKYQVFPSDEIIVGEFPYKETYRLGYFKDDYSYLAFLKDDEIWMSVNPNEINTMAPYIEKARGDVLVLGLGMGYIAYMMALKPEVKKITIVEKDNNVISIFKHKLFPLFKNKEKISVIHDDGIRYLENNKGFSAVFADLWHNPEDGLPLYLRLKEIEKKQKIKIDYWLETSLRAMERRCLITLLEENLLGYTDKDYRYAKTPMDQAINALYKKYKDKEFETLDDLKKFLD